MFFYVSAIIGESVENIDYGKNKVILTFSMVYWIGILILFWSTNQTKNSVFNFTTLCGLVFILIGVGGIKCCMGAFDVEINIKNIHTVTSVTPSQVHGFVRFCNITNILYYSVHLGVLYWMINSPIKNTIESLKGQNCNKYSIHFGLVIIIVMSISLGVFVCESPYYLFKKSFTSILFKMMKCILVSLWKRLTSCCNETKNKHWLELAKDSFSNKIINDSKKMLHLLCLYIPLSVFWSLFDKQHTTWIFEASRTSDHLIVIPFKVYMLQVVNSLLVLFIITYMNRMKSIIVLSLMENSLCKEDNALCNSPSAMLVPGNLYMNSEKKHPYMIYIIVPSNKDGRISISQFKKKSILKILYGLYTPKIHYMAKKLKPISMRNSLGNLAVILFNKCVTFGKKSNMFAFIALLMIIVKLINTDEKWYFKKKKTKMKTAEGRYYKMNYQLPF